MVVDILKDLDFWVYQWVDSLKVAEFFRLSDCCVWFVSVKELLTIMMKRKKREAEQRQDLIDEHSGLPSASVSQ